jgi:hypothetical protein
MSCNSALKDKINTTPNAVKEWISNNFFVKMQRQQILPSHSRMSAIQDSEVDAERNEKQHNEIDMQVRNPNNYKMMIQQFHFQQGCQVKNQ